MSSLKSQKSAANPGWVGSGVPSIYSLIIRSKKFFRMLINYQVNEAKHFFLATLADLWNFYIYPGNRHVQCPCCGWTGKGFIATANWRATTYQSRCPQCDSRSRHRGLYNYLCANEHLVKNKKVLFFAPEKIVWQTLEKLYVGEVVTTDYRSIDVDFPGEDIQKLTFSSGQFDLIICNHVLEHVADNVAAIAECARVLKNGGVALFTIPGDFNKHETWTFKELDDNGHFRHYGLDVISKFEKRFEIVNPIDMSELGQPSHRIRKLDYLFVCIKKGKDEAYL